MKWSEVDISLNHDVMTLFTPRVTMTSQIWGHLAGVMVYEYTYMPLGWHANDSNTLCMSDRDV